MLRELLQSITQDSPAQNSSVTSQEARTEAEQVELLAEYAHNSWSGWMRYLMDQGTLNADGTWTIPAWAVERWRRQMITSYAELPENEKESDRVEARTILKTLNG